MALYLDVLPGETVSIGPNTRITIEKKNGQRTRLRIESPEDVHKTVDPVLTRPPSRNETTAEPTLRRPGLKPA